VPVPALGRVLPMVPRHPTTIFVAEYTNAGGGTPTILRRQVVIRRAREMVLLVSDLNRLRPLPANSGWNCSTYHYGWYDQLRLSYRDRPPLAIKVWTGCPPVVVLHDMMYGNQSGQPWLRLVADLNRILS
jgi:hypothetical protein